MQPNARSRLKPQSSGEMYDSVSGKLSTERTCACSHGGLHAYERQDSCASSHPKVKYVPPNLVHSLSLSDLLKPLGAQLRQRVSAKAARRPA